MLHVWTGAGKCDQNENQPYILQIAASNVTIRNFAYKNVTGWAGKDALTTQYAVCDGYIVGRIGKGPSYLHSHGNRGK